MAGGLWLPSFDGLSPVAAGVVETFNLSPRGREDNFGFRFDANLLISTEGSYTFSTTSDDGSRLYIGDQCVVDNWVFMCRRRCRESFTLQPVFTRSR